MDRADTFRTRCVNPSSRAGDHHDVGFFHQIVQAAAIHSRVSSDGNTVNGHNFALHTVFNGFSAQFFGFIFERFIELVDVNVNHLIEAFCSAQNNVKSFGAFSVVLFIAFRKGTYDVDHFGADIEPLSGLRIDNTLERLVSEFNSQLVCVMLSCSNAGFDSAVSALRVDVHEGTDGSDALRNHELEELTKSSVEVLFSGF